MQIKSKSQSSLEYLIVMGIAIFILVAAISYAIYYQVGYNSAGNSQDLQLAAESIANAISSISTAGVGSSAQFSFSSPGLSLTSSICNTSISLSYAGEEASQSLPILTTGELPINSGTYSGTVKLVKENGRPQAQLMMQLPISYISTSYIYNPSSIFYNVSFFDSSANLVGDVNFTLIIYSNNKIVAEQNETTLSGYYSGSITPSTGQFAPNSVAEIYVRSLGIISPSCFLPQNLLLVPSNVLNFIPLTISNNQNTATPSPFQQEVVIDSADYQQYETANLQNVEFFYSNGTVINSWLESGNSDTATSTVYWLKLGGIPASSSLTVYMGFAGKTANLFNNTNDGEAPQLSATYGEYNDIGSVMNPGLLVQFYQLNGGGIQPQNSVYQAPMADGTTFAYGSLTATTNIPPFTTALSGNSQDVDGTTQNNVIINYQYSYSGGIAFPNPPITNQQYVIMKAIGFAQVNNPTTFTGLTDDGMGVGYSTSGSGIIPWLGGTSTSNNPNNIINSWVGQGATKYSGSINAIGTYRLEVDYTNQGGPGYDGFWSNVSVGYYSPAEPPSGVMPAVTIGTVQPQITVFVNGVKNGNNGIASGDTTNITAFGIHASHIGLEINGSVAVPLGSASLSYQKALPVGLYNITVFSNQSNLANQTYWEAVANIPKGIKNFVPVSITNQQSSSTPSPFQQNISINSFAYHNFENQSLNNVEFFSPSGNTIPSWLQLGDLASFNGASSYANLPGNYPFSAASTFTVSVWFKTTSDGVVLWNSGAQFPANNGYSPIIYVTTAGDLAGGDWVGSQPFDTNYFVANGKWNLVTITQTPSEQILYLNGNEIATKSGTPQSFSSTYWTVGAGYTNGWSGTNNGNFYFNGYISNLQFYNQVFSPSKVALLYDEGLAGLPLNSSGLIAWYLLSGNGNQQNGHNTLAINNIQFNGVSSASTNTSYWLKVGSIQPKGSYIAFMGFALPNISLFNNTNDGEAPQLSATYGQYDDGANVFLQYGGGGSTGWSKFTFVGGSWTTANGYLQQTATTGSYNGGPAALIEGASYPITAEYVLSMAFNYITEADARVGIITTATPTSTPDVFGYRFIGQQGSGGAGFLSFLNDQVAWVVDNTYQGAVSTQYTMTVTDAGGTWSGSLYSGYGTETSTPLTSLASTSYTTANSQGKTSGYVGISAAYCGSTCVTANPINVMWFYMRAYPPNGVMPIETVGPLNGIVS